MKKEDFRFYEETDAIGWKYSNVHNGIDIWYDGQVYEVKDFTYFEDVEDIEYMLETLSEVLSDVFEELGLL